MHKQMGLFLSVYVDDINMTGKKHNLEPMRKSLMKHVDLEKPTQFLDQVNLRCTQHDCKPNKNLVDEYRKMFESLTSAGAVERLPRSGDVHAKITAWTQDIEGRAKKCVKRYFEPANKNSEQLLQVSTPCIDDHQFKKEDGGDCGRTVKKCAL